MALDLRFGELAQDGVALLIRREEAFDLELLQRHVLRRAERGDDAEQAHAPGKLIARS